MANLMNAIPESNAAPSKASTGVEKDDPYKCGYTTVDAEPSTPLVQSEVPGQGAAIGGDQEGSNIRSYSFQTPTMSATSGMPVSKK